MRVLIAVTQYIDCSDPWKCLELDLALQIKEQQRPSSTECNICGATRCIRCGECVLICPTGAWSRNPVKYFRMVIPGRTGKKNPRMAASFLDRVTEETVIQVMRNVYAFIDEHIDRTLLKEHLGYIVDRTGYPAFRDAVLTGVELGPNDQVAESLEFHGYRYERSTNMCFPASG